MDALTKEQKQALPLFGIPISVKENYTMKGHNSNVGCSSRLGHVDEVDNAIVKVRVSGMQRELAASGGSAGSSAN